MSTPDALHPLDDQMLQGLSEAVLANYMALRLADIPEDEIKIIVGPDGGTVVGAGILLQTPVSKRLTDATSHRFRSIFAQLYLAYEADDLDSARLAAIIRRHNVAHKVQAIRAQSETGSESL